MIISKVLAAAIWIYSMVTYASFQVPEKMLGGFTLSEDYFVLLVPIVLSTLFSFKARGYPFDIPALSARVDSLCGPGAYARFLVDVKPLLLFGVSGMVAGCSQLFLLYQQQNGATPFHAAFMFSTGISFLIVRIILKKRGLLMETPDGTATPG